jgi:hypothetical protein
MSAMVVRPASDSRSSLGAFTPMLLKATRAAERAFLAPSRATFTWRIISQIPSAVLGTLVAVPFKTDRAALSASRGSDLPF